MRALATAGQHSAARALLASVPVSKLAELPSDRDYLGTLGHLTAAALELQSHGHYEALYELLLPHATRFAIGISGLNEGSVEQLLGQLASRRGDSARAVKHLEAGVRANRAAGLGLRTEIAQRELARATHAQ